MQCIFLFFQTLTFLFYKETHTKGKKKILIHIAPTIQMTKTIIKSTTRSTRRRIPPSIGLHAGFQQKGSEAQPREHIQF